MFDDNPLVYLTGPSTDPAALDRAALALTAAGYAVTTATPTVGADVDDLLSAVADDLDALAAADLLVTVGDCSALFEPTAADLYGVPVVALADVLAEVTR